MILELLTAAWISTHKDSGEFEIVETLPIGQYLCIPETQTDKEGYVYFYLIDDDQRIVHLRIKESDLRKELSLPSSMLPEEFPI